MAAALARSWSGELDSVNAAAQSMEAKSIGDTFKLQASSFNVEVENDHRGTSDLST